MAPEVSAGAAGGEGGNETGLPARILEAATRLFAEHGWTGTSVRAVARETGCSTPALYYHFEGKDALWAAAVEHCYGRVTEIQTRVRVSSSSLREQLIGSVRQVAEIATHETHVLWLLYRAVRHAEEGQPDNPFAERRAQTRMQSVALFENGIVTGELREDVDAEVLVDLLHGAVDYRLTELFYYGRPFEERWAERMVEQLLQGLEP